MTFALLLGRATTLLNVSMVLALCACARAAACSERWGLAVPPADKALEPRGSQDMKTLSQETLGDCAHDTVAVVLALVEHAEIAAPGARGETAFLRLRVERTVCGTVPASLEAWRYTSEGDTALEAGKKYIVALVRQRGPVPYALGEFVLVPAGREAQAVDAHLALLRKSKDSQR
jgi:hypothetical protein